MADGTKVSAKTCEGTGLAYRGSFTYHLGSDDPAAEDFESVPFGGGRIVATSGNDIEVRYFLTDHLGSTRVVARVTPTGREDLDRKDYYPFGKAWTQSGMPTSGNRYTFSGKEQVDVAIEDGITTPIHDFGARYYDSNGVLFFQQDPLMEKYYSIGQYNYCAGNPIARVDIKGAIWVDTNGNKVWNGTGWTEYATPEYRELGNTLRSTPTGVQQFEKLESNPAEIKVIINNTEMPSKYGQMNALNHATRNKNTGVSRLNSGAEIVIYKLNAEKRAQNSEGKLTTVEAMAVNFGHEIEHTTDESVTLNANQASVEEREKKPNAISNQLIKEYERQKPIVDNPDNIF